MTPLGVRQDSRYAVDGDDAFTSGFVAIDDERDAFVIERTSHTLLHRTEVKLGQVRQRRVKFDAMLPRRTVAVKHLVVERRLYFVFLELQSGIQLCSRAACSFSCNNGKIRLIGYQPSIANHMRGRLYLLPCDTDRTAPGVKSDERMEVGDEHEFTVAALSYLSGY